METMTLANLRTEVIYEAGIDGVNGSDARHDTNRLNSIINRYWQSVRTLVGIAGEPWFQVIDTVQTLPSATAGEEFVEVPFPTAAVEITGIDVLKDGEWIGLDPVSWAQRRVVDDDQPEGGAGFYAIKSLPEARSSASVTAGSIAIWPTSLSGSSYRVTYVEQWTAITNDAHVFVGRPDWFTWVINSCVMTITKRDSNKRDIFAEAKLQKDEAEDRIRLSSKRVQRGGAVVPRRRGGELF